MSDPDSKFRGSHRRHSDLVAIRRQTRILKSRFDAESFAAIQQPHRLAKTHAMDCGRPNCMLCGNPRKLYKELTHQEKRLFQDTEQVRDKHSNGLIPKSELE